MNFEVLKKNHLKRNILIAVVIVFVLSAAILTFTKAKYRITQSIPLIQGTINYSPSDLNIVAMYLNQDGAIPAGQTDIAPKFGYTLNEEQSFCEVNDEKINNAAFTYENGLLGFYNLNRKGTKCSVYFDLIPDSEDPVINTINSSSDDTSITISVDASDNIGIYYYYYKLDNEEEIKLEENRYTFEGLEKDSVHTITVRVEDAAGNLTTDNLEVTVGLTAKDAILASHNAPTGQMIDWTEGKSYYYTGDTSLVEVNNWLQFAGFYWRIIRINGDGTIRVIYQGATANTTGTETQIGTSAFNSSRNNNMYVGYMYGSNSSNYNTTHSNSNSSTIKSVLDNWYSTYIENEQSNIHYEQYIDGNAGFCGDRTPSTSNSSSNGSGGTGIRDTYYGAYIRLVSNNNPSLQCNSRDIYTTSDSNIGNKSLQYPIGLVTADEVVLAGGGPNVWDYNYYLYTGQNYWTMSPDSYDSYSSYGASVFLVYNDDYLGAGPTLLGQFVNSSFGVRPVINLRSDVQITGTGSQTDPFVVVGAS